MASMCHNAGRVNTAVQTLDILFAVKMKPRGRNVWGTDIQSGREGFVRATANLVSSRCAYSGKHHAVKEDDSSKCQLPAFFVNLSRENGGNASVLYAAHSGPTEASSLLR